MKAHPEYHQRLEMGTPAEMALYIRFEGNLKNDLTDEDFLAVDGSIRTIQRGHLSGVFETTVTVAGQDVIVTGRVMEGMARISNFYIP